MRYLALVCDYDGTLAAHGVMDDATVDALRRVRASGRALLLVTDRRSQAGRLHPHLDVFDRRGGERRRALPTGDRRAVARRTTAGGLVTPWAEG
jgi:hypothetical protein